MQLNIYRYLLWKQTGVDHNKLFLNWIIKDFSKKSAIQQLKGFFDHRGNHTAHAAHMGLEDILKLPYPPSGLLRVPVPLIPLKDVEAHIIGFIVSVINEIPKADKDLVECSTTQKWQKPTTYVVKDKNMKKALMATVPDASGVRIPMTKEMADKVVSEKYAGKPDVYVEERLGEDTRCLYYCNIGKSGKCSYYNAQFNKGKAQ